MGKYGFPLIKFRGIGDHHTDLTKKQNETRSLQKVVLMSEAHVYGNVREGLPTRRVYNVLYESGACGQSGVHVYREVGRGGGGGFKSKRAAKKSCEKATAKLLQPSRLNSFFGLFCLMITHGKKLWVTAIRSYPCVIIQTLCNHLRVYWSGGPLNLISISGVICKKILVHWNITLRYLKWNTPSS